MDLLPSDEQHQIAASAASLLDREFPLSSRREVVTRTEAVDRAQWRTCGALGWFGLGLPTDDGGVGCSLAEETVLFREIGRLVAPGPFLSCVLGAHLAAAVADHDLAKGIVGGDVVVALAEPHFDASVVVGEHCSGTFRVLDGPGSDLVLVVDEHHAALVSSTALGELASVPCIDASVRLSVVTANAPAVAFLDDATSLQLRGTVLCAAALVGISEATRDMSVEYAKVREQFGRPIGAFQAVKHRCADMALRSEAALSQTLYASLIVDAGCSDGSFQASAAKVVALDAAVENATYNIQNHGAVGCTVEIDAHWYLRRARLLEHVLGRPADHLRQLLEAPAAQ